MAKSAKAKTKKTPAAPGAARRQSGRAAASAPRPGAPSAAQVCTVLGAATWLATRSVPHRRLSIAEVERRLLPPIVLNQTRLFHYQQKPIAFVCWARVSEAVEARLMAGEPLRPADWNSGDRPWVVDIIAPFAKPGGAEEIVRRLTVSAFNGVQPAVLGSKPARLPA